MTEREWLACADPRPMLRSLCRRPRRARRGGPGLDPERFRVFAVECGRRVWNHLTDDLRIVLEHQERYLHNTVPSTLAQAWETTFQNETQRLGAEWTMELVQIIRGKTDYRRIVEIDAQRAAAQAVGYAATARPYLAAQQHTWAAKAVGLQELLDRTPPGRPVPRTNTLEDEWLSAAELQAQAAVLRDVFGNPFRPVAFNPRWRTDTAVSLARRMADGREFSAMPILADALQDAGCEAAVILDHCRDPQQLHVRRCWVIDLVLGLS